MILKRMVGPTTTQNLVVKFDGEICSGVLVEMFLTISPPPPPAKETRKSPSKLRRKFATNFAENFANFTLEIAGAKKNQNAKRLNRRSSKKGLRARSTPREKEAQGQKQCPAKL